jgi:hypothetical protein
MICDTKPPVFISPLTDAERNDPKVALGSPDAFWPLMATT